MGAYWGCYRGARARPSIQDFDAILFDDRIGQHFMRDGFDVRLRLLARGSTGQRDFEELALTHFGDGGEPEAVERRAHGLALRVENGGLRSYEYASFHGNSNYRMAGSVPGGRQPASRSAVLTVRDNRGSLLTFT